MTRDGTAEHVSRDQILRHARVQGSIHFPCSADHEQDYWQPYPVGPYSAICDDHTYSISRAASIDSDFCCRLPTTSVFSNKADKLRSNQF